MDFINKKDISRHIKEELGIDDPETIFEKGNLNREAIKAVLYKFTLHRYNENLQTLTLDHPQNSKIKLVYANYPLEDYDSLDSLMKDMRYVLNASREKIFRYRNFDLEAFRKEFEDKGQEEQDLER